MMGPEAAQEQRRKAKYLGKDQTFCPKCGRMYCEGYWGEGICIADMTFSSEPTARGDDIASYLRVWYEAHRESFWDRHIWKLSKPWQRGLADEFMLGLINEMRRIDGACRKPDRPAAESLKPVNASDIDPTAGADPNFKWDGDG